MSVPQSDNQPSHHVVRMVYDKHSMRRFFAFNFFLSIVLIVMLFYTLSVIDGQSKQITQLSKMVNQLSFRVDEVSIDKLETQEIKDVDQGEKFDSATLSEISHVLELHHKELKKIYALINKMNYEMAHDLGTIKMLLEEQKESSWQLKEIISSLKKKTELISQTFENIDFGSVGDKIKGTFNNIKDKVGSMFENGEETKVEGLQVQKNSQGFFSSIKNKVKSKVNSWTKGKQQL